MKEKGGLSLDEGVSGWSDGGMLLRREDEVRGKQIHPLGDIMRGSSCLPLGQTTHRCEGASGPVRVEGERWSPCGMTSLSEPELPLTPAPLAAVPGPPWMKKEINHALNAPEKTPVVPRMFWVVRLTSCLAKLWPTWRGTACQRLISTSLPLPL